MDILRKFILPIGVICCGTFLATCAYDQSLTSRHIMWCVLTLVLLVSTKEIRLNCFALGFLLFVLISVAGAVNKSEWLYAALRAVLFVTFLSVVKIDKKVLAKTMVVLGLFFAVYFWWDYSDVGEFGLCRGVMSMKNFWSAAHFLVIPFCVYLMAKKEKLWAEPQRDGFVVDLPWDDIRSEYRWKCFAGLVFVLMVVNIFLLSSRSVILALGVSSFVAFRKYRIYLLVGILLVVLLMGGRIANIESLGHRFEQWECTLSMIKANPWGVGAGNWWIMFPKYAPAMTYPDAFSWSTFRHPHNDFIWMCAEVGILGFICYLGMFLSALYKNKEKWLVMGLVGYMVIVSFTALHERAFASLIAASFISMSYVGVKVKAPQLLILLLLFAMVVFGYRYRSSCYNKKLRATTKWSQIPAYTKGRSMFSTLTHAGYPYYWWDAISKLRTGSAEESILLFEKAYEDNPYNVHVINGMGVACGLRGDNEQAISYFRQALEICPDFEDARKNLVKMEAIQ
jgi:hypothetical protein